MICLCCCHPKTKKGKTPVHIAVGQNLPEELECMLSSLKPFQCTKVLMITNNEEDRALDIAQSTGHTDCVNYIHKIRDSSTEGEKDQSSSRPVFKRKESNFNAKGIPKNFENLTILRKIGFGKECIVYEGTCATVPIAIKCFTGFIISTEGMDQLRDCDILRSLRHENLVHFFGIAQLDKGLSLIMELCDTDLHTLSQLPGTGDNEKPTKRGFMKLIKDTLHGLIFLHSKDIVHMDIRPNKILIKSGTAKLTDFGISVLADDDVQLIEQLTSTGSHMYSAPELLDQVLPTKGSDMWAIGITALEVMTGHPAYFEVKLWKGKLTPSALLKGHLPSALSYLKERNQKIFRNVLQLKPDGRSTAAKWLARIHDYSFD
ncbi:MAP3K4 [Bugula neritina]|uniref:mitogen-activated protein kinase kinase n=1 Tax=Bugula neritina TaxID=10212 RepID=A0A7J7JJ91_BUGNE|nr:MAP3K4 [Bugula neritina]